MIKGEGIIHRYGNEEVLHGVSIHVRKPEFVVLSGESGSGKSTLLSVLSTLLTPSAGQVEIGGMNIKSISDIDTFRRSKIGFVFQFHYLINYLNVRENIALPQMKLKNNVDSLLERLHISELSKRYPQEISGGQRQRVALARALVNHPQILFADEPTGSLDSHNAKIVYNMMRDFCDEGMTIVVASHDPKILDYADRTIRMIDGSIV